jgi:hypothetical protein
MLELLVQENVHQFFLREVPFVTTSVHSLGPGEALGGIVDTSLVDAVIAACAETRYALRTVYPDADPRLQIRPRRLALPSSPISGLRAMMAIAACALACIAALVAPGLAADAATRRATRELATLSHAQHDAADETQDAQQTTNAIDAIGRFEHERRSVTLLLSTLASALPPESAITTLRVDTAMAEMVVVSTRAAAVLGAMDRMPGIVAPAMIGPVSRDVVNGRDIERATIHFRYDAARFNAARVPYTVTAVHAE